MNPMRLIVLLIALGAAGMATLLLGGVFGTKAPAVAAPVPQVDMTEVLVASKDIDVGHAVVADDLHWQAWPRDAASGQFITKDTNPAGLETMVGSVARTTVLSGEPVTTSKVVKAENASFMAAALTPGMRAVSVELNEQSGAGGFILPNDRVDVILTADAGSSEDGMKRVYTRTLLQNIRVLAVGQAFRDPSGENATDSKTVQAKTATLEISPQEAEIIEQAGKLGQLSLSLRGLTKSDTPVAEVRVPAGQKGRQSNNTITIIRFGTATQVQTAGN